MSEVLSRQKLRELVDGWVEAGKSVAGPVRVKADLVLYQALGGSGELVLDGTVRPANSIKEFIFPRHEKLYGYRIHGKEIELVPAEAFEREQVIVGARPCDAAALPILDRLFHWDFEDAFYNQRRERTTVVTVACRDHDEHCFCTSVGLGPDAEQGSDVLLFELDNEHYGVRVITDRGRALFAGQTETSDAVGVARMGPEKRVDVEAVQAVLAGQFENPIWQSAALRCLGCGACAYHCPTCHCFDIVDEKGPAGGARVRNWDTCQATMFTMHASGHNPRGTQAQRQRQRVYHKYRIYPDKFGVIACTGCGNCTRNCPVGLGIRNVLGAIEDASASEASEACQ